jgi:hypothetical protein
VQPNPADTTTTVGVATLLSRGQYAHDYWYWISVGALIGFFVVFNIGFTLSLGFMPGKSNKLEKTENNHYNIVILQDFLDYHILIDAWKP